MLLFELTYDQYVCVHTIDRYDLDIAVLTLKFLMGSLYVVLNKTFTITSKVKIVRFKEGLQRNSKAQF